MEEIKQPEVAEVKPAPKEEDLVTKVSKVEIKEPTKEVETFNVTDIDKIQDPEGKKYADQAYKSFQRGFNQKFQDLAVLRKEYEAKLAEPSNWTPERVQGLLKDEEFVKAAQSVAGVKSDDYSALSDVEKKQLKEIQTQMSGLVNQNAQLLRSQEDEGLKGKYANYNSGAVDILTGDLLQGKVKATREHLHKVLDYDDAVRRAYELGKQDKKLDIQEKVTSISPEGVTAVSNKDVPEKEKGESDRNFFKRLVLDNAKKSAESGEVRK